MRSTSPVEPSPYGVFVEHAKKQQLAYQVDAAGNAVFPPRVVEPGDQKLSWAISKGTGVVYSVTTARRANQPPENLSIVELDEGFRMMTRVETDGPVCIGMRVRVAFSRSEDVAAYPIFVPADQKP